MSKKSSTFALAFGTEVAPTESSRLTATDSLRQLRPQLSKKQKALFFGQLEKKAIFFRRGGTTERLICAANLLAKFVPTRAFSSAGLEHLPYKQRVCGSNP